jgi:UDP-glucuronate 4-epimerase
MGLAADKTVLVTGAAGFIGAFACRRLLAETGARVVGFDNMNDYYDVSLKEERLRMLEDASSESSGGFVFVRGDLADVPAVDELFYAHHPDIVVNLAAQAGVRYSLDNPRAYIDSNVSGFLNILEACRASMTGEHPVEHLVYASSSSVYGDTCEPPYSEEQRTDEPVSLYAATKKADELMAHAYAHLYGVPATGLRFFTVYGPMGRPDMAYFKFAEKMRAGNPIQVYNNGDMLRDFTYIDDVVTGVAAVLGHVPAPDERGVRHKVYNIGNSAPVRLLDFIDTLERVLLEEGAILGPVARELLPMQPGDVYQTCADTSALQRDFGFAPGTPLEDGLRAFARWYGGYRGQA